MPEDPRLADLIKTAEEREAVRKKEQSTEDVAQQKQTLIQFREHITAVLSQEVRDALGEPEGGTLARNTLDFHPSSLPRDKRLADKETQPDQESPPRQEHQ